MRYELVEDHAGWHARMVAGNNRIVWWTENYVRKADALEAIRMVRVATHYDGRVIATGYSNEVQVIEVNEATEPMRAPEPELPPPGQMPT